MPQALCFCFFFFLVHYQLKAPRVLKARFFSSPHSCDVIVAKDNVEEGGNSFFVPPWVQPCAAMTAPLGVGTGEGTNWGCIWWTFFLLRLRGLCSSLLEWGFQQRSRFSWAARRIQLMIELYIRCECSFLDNSEQNQQEQLIMEWWITNNGWEGEGENKTGGNCSLLIFCIFRIFFSGAVLVVVFVAWRHSV